MGNALEGLSKLKRLAPPPASPVLGDLSRAQSIFADYGLSYPDEYWQLLGEYGAGSFYGERAPFELLSPAVPAFAYWYTWVVAAGPGSVSSQGIVQIEDWLPVAIEREYVLFVPSSDSKGSGVLFLSLGSQDEYFASQMSFADFVAEYPTEQLQLQIFGDPDTSLFDDGFAPAEPLWHPDTEKVRRRAERFAGLSGLFDELVQCWPQTH